MSEALRTLTPVVAVFALLLGLMWLAFGELLDQRANPNQGIVSGREGPQRIELQPNAGGHYVAPGQINGRDVTFLIDTGASHVAVPAGIADQLGLERGPEIRVVTAAGTTRAYHTRIDRIALGGIEVEDVRGSINPAMGGDQVLLGMTFLREVEFRQIGERLILERPGA